MNSVGSPFWFLFKRVSEHSEDTAVDAVEATLQAMTQTSSLQGLPRNIWPADIFHRCDDEAKLYAYVQQCLYSIHGDTRIHHEVAQDGSVSIGLGEAFVGDILEKS